MHLENIKQLQNNKNKNKLLEETSPRNLVGRRFIRQYRVTLLSTSPV